MKRVSSGRFALLIFWGFLLASGYPCESKAEKWGVAPAYFRELAIVYRKQGRIEDEITILERYFANQLGPGVGPNMLKDRLDKAKLLLEKQKKN